MDRLKDKVAVVTGSGRGIGRGIAIAMASEGAKVVVNDIGGAADGTGVSQTPAEEVCDFIKKQGGMAVPNFDSVADPKGAENIIKTALDNFGTIDILVNNAGILRDRMIWNMTDEEWDAVIKVHLYGTFYCTRAACRIMREKGWGRIINFTSHSGILGNPGQPNYGAAKAGIIGFTKSCALALGRYGITVNAVAPRASTRLTDTIPEDRLRQLAARRGIPGADTMPLEEVKKRFLGGVPEAIAPLVVWLASEDAKDVNGQVFMAMQGQIGLFNQMEEMRRYFKKEDDGIWTIDEMWEIMPILTQGLVNPAPPEKK